MGRIHDAEGVYRSDDFAILISNRAGVPLNANGLGVLSGDFHSFGRWAFAEKDLVDGVLSMSPVDVLAKNMGDGAIDDLIGFEAKEGLSGAVPLHDVPIFVEGKARERQFVKQRLVALEGRLLDALKVVKVGNGGFGLLLGGYIFGSEFDDFGFKFLAPFPEKFEFFTLFASKRKESDSTER